MRDKLESLMLDYEQEYNSFVFDRGRLANYLIAHGVTFADVPDTNVGCKWIPVSERLPEKGGDYMVCKTLKRYDGNPCYIRTIATFSHCLEKMDEHDLAGLKRPGWCKYDSEYGYYESTDITHWMPLPEAPKEDE